MENNASSAPVHRLVGRFHKGDGEYIRSVCDFSSGGHARRICRIAKAIDDNIVFTSNAVKLLIKAKENFSLVGDDDWKTLVEIEAFISKHNPPNAKADLAPASGAQVQRLVGRISESGENP
jgi:hypothetical protein